MMCVNGCKQLRHDGPCEPVYDDEPDLEWLALDAAQANDRYLKALERHNEQQ